MLSVKVRKRIKERKMKKHSNPSLFFSRIKNASVSAIKDLTLIAEKFDEEQLEDIFTEKELEQLIKIILKPRSKRTIMITEALAYQIWQKLARELPTDMVNNLGGDISKTWVYAKLLSQYADKPMMRQSKK